MPQARPFHVMAKPFGSICNLDCTYCYYLEKENLYPGTEDFRIPDEVLEAFIRQYIASQDSPEVSFAWQGGEPTLLGLDFFKRVVELQAVHAEGKQISNVIQTNGTRLDDGWCEFLATHGFLVGLSIDGPEELHDAYRVDKGGKPSFHRVMEGLALLKKHGTEFNTLTVVNRLNSQRPVEVYDFLKSIGSRFFQFIPLVEREADEESRQAGLSLAGPPPMASLPVLQSRPPTPARVAGDPAEGLEQASPPVTPWSVEPRQFGEFMVSIFDHWVRSDVGEVFVQIFDTTLAGWMGMEPPLCVFAETCGHAMALEHNGDLYSCDHYVYPGYKLGNILDTDLKGLARSPFQVAFGEAKRKDLPQFCLDCEVRFLCNGECPKHRFIATPEGEPGLNYLCAGYKRFFTHSGPQMEIMAELLRQRRPPAEIMQILAAQDRERAMRSAGRNDPCPCGSGKKFKQCCGGP